MAADAADRTDGDAGLSPVARSQSQPQHLPDRFRIARFPPHDAADLCIDIRGHKGGDRGMVTGQAEGEVVLQLLAVAETGLQKILPVGNNAQEAVRRMAHLEEAARFQGPWRQERRGIVNLGDQSFRTDPVSPGFAGRLRQGCLQTTSMTRQGPLQESPVIPQCSWTLTPKR